MAAVPNFEVVAIYPVGYEPNLVGITFGTEDIKPNKSGRRFDKVWPLTKGLLDGRCRIVGQYESAHGNKHEGKSYCSAGISSK